MRLTALKTIIYSSGYRQRYVAEQAEIPENRLAQAVTGRCRLTDAERQALAKVLKKTVAELFPADER